MDIQVEAIKESLCTAFCQDVDVAIRGDNIAVALPMAARDGDVMVAYLRPIAAGFRVSDMGSTMMRLSYENDLGKLLSGARAQLYETILKESGLSENDGEIYVDVPASGLTQGLFALGQGLTRVEDVGLWTKARVESTFYEDLNDILMSFLSTDVVRKDYIAPSLPDAESYPIDYYIQTPGRPLYLFGVNSSNKARLATIILQHLQAHDANFESLVVCSSIDDLTRQDRNRLMNAANDIVPSITETAVIEKKIRHRLRA